MFKRSNAPVIMVVFGASGDLTKRKLLPALFSLYKQKLLPEQFAILGYARTPSSDESFRTQAIESIKEFGTDGYDEALVQSFAPHLCYMHGGYEDLASFEKLATRIAELRDDLTGDGANNELDGQMEVLIKL